MKKISFYQECQIVLQHLEKNENQEACRKAELLRKTHPDNALICYVTGLCYRRTRDVFKTIEYLTLTLRNDPSFTSAAEMLLELNKDNYTVGELKYLYEIIANYKEADPEMLRFLQKFKDVPVKPDLTIPERPAEQVATASFTGIDDNAYIQHLINEMDKPEVKSLPTEEKPEKVPTPAYRPPRQKIPVASQNNIKNGNGSAYGIETMTMAQLYIRQGLYDNAMDILLKLQKRDPLSERIKNEIKRLNGLIEKEMKEKE
jgi:tetratricopeptide (TPR) repeat protein